MKEERLRKRIGVYGGTFDPVHNGHFKVADAVLKSFAMDRMLFVPAFVPPHKSGWEISSPYHRLAMLALATADRERIFVSTIELEAPSRPYTVETLGRLRTEHGEDRLFFVMGADSFNDITTWRDYDRILNTYDVIVASRPGYQAGYQAGYQEGCDIAGHLRPDLRARMIDLRGGLSPPGATSPSPHIYYTDYVAIDISSSDVRERVTKGHAIDGLVPAAVAGYIAKYRLYQNSECQKS